MFEESCGQYHMPLWSMSSSLLGVFLVFFIFTHTHTHTHSPCCAGSDEKGTKNDVGKTGQDIKWH
jgi:hypothetical protein